MQQNGGMAFVGANGDPAQEIGVTIRADLASAINYACWQNSVPFLKSLKVANNRKDILKDLEIIAIAELVGCVHLNPELLDEVDPALSFARLIGLDRLSAASRARLEEAIERARGLA